LRAAIGARPRATALAVYALGSLLFFVRPILAHPRVTCICYGAANPDPTLFMWGFAWWPKALTFAHGNPIVSHSIFYPHGANLAHTTSTPGPAVLLWPLTAAFGPVFAYDVVIALSPVLSGFCAFLLCFELTRRLWPALLGGWLFGFSQYELASMTGHLHLALAFCLPLVAWLVVLRMRARLGRRAFVGLLALTLLVQISISTEVFASLTGFGVLALAIAVLVWPSERRALGRVALELGAAYAAALLVASPYLWYALSSGGPKRLSGSAVTTDLLSPFVPTLLDKIGGIRLASLSERFRAGWGEGMAYLGVPAVLIAGFYLWSARRSRTAWFLAGVAAVALVASFGAKLYVAGHPTIPLPWAVVDDLPLVGGALPVRFFVYTALAVSVMAALWLARPRRNWLVPGLLGVLAAVALVPNLGHTFWFKRMDLPPLIADGGWRKIVRTDDVVLILPHTSTGQAMLWQSWTRIGFKMAGGYFGYNWDDPDEHEPIYPLFVDQRRAYGDVGVAPLRSYIARHGVTIVFVDPIQAGPWPQYLAALGWRGAALGGLWVYRAGQTQT
jgi:hypothetical protein